MNYSYKNPITRSTEYTIFKFFLLNPELKQNESELFSIKYI